MINFNFVKSDTWCPTINNETIFNLFNIFNEKMNVIQNGTVSVNMITYERFEFIFDNVVIANLDVYTSSGKIGEYRFFLPLNNFLKLGFYTSYDMKISPDFKIISESWTSSFIDEKSHFLAGVELYTQANRLEYYAKSHQYENNDSFQIENNTLVEVMYNTLDYEQIIDLIRLSYLAHEHPQEFFDVFQEKDFKKALKNPMLSDNIEALKMLSI